MDKSKVIIALDKSKATYPNDGKGIDYGIYIIGWDDYKGRPEFGKKEFALHIDADRADDLMMMIYKTYGTFPVAVYV
jgi:hypothetical protein